MLRISNINSLREKVRISSTYLAVAMMALAGLTPVFLQSVASAGQLTPRKVTLSSSKIGASSVTYNFNFRVTQTSVIRGLVVEICQNSPIVGDTCTTTNGITGTPDNPATVTFTNTGSSGDATWDVHANSTTSGLFIATDQDGATGGDGLTPVTTADFTFSFTATNPSGSISTGGAPTSYYARILTYSAAATAAAYTSASPGTYLDNGSVALSTARQLTVTGVVQERLDFCVAALGDGGAADTTLTALANVAGCAALTDTSVNLGVIDNDDVNLAPVDAAAPLLGDDTYGIAMINTNGSGGTALTYIVDPVVAGTSAAAGETDYLRAFRVNGNTIDCNATETTYTDPCFRSAAATGSSVVEAQEWFGLYIPCVDTSQGTVATPMTVSADYDGQDGSTTSVADCENEDKDDVDGNNAQTLAWNATTSAVSLATSTGVLDDVIVKLAFGAAADSLTPTGSYQVVTTYIATPTF